MKGLLCFLVIAVFTSGWAFSCKKGERLAHPDSCHKYVECVNSTHYEERWCPWKYMEKFDPVKQNCDSFWKVKNCKLSNCFEGNMAPIPQVCDAFYICLNNEIVKLTCPQGQKFDPIKLTCSANYNCSTTPYCVEGYRFPVVGDKTCKQYMECKSGVFVNEKCGLGKGFNPELSDCKWGYECPVPKHECKGEWKIPDPDDCQYYQECKHGKHYRTSCGFLHRFDAVKMKCGWRFSVACKNDDDKVENKPKKV